MEIRALTWTPLAWGDELEGWLHHIEDVDRHMSTFQARVTSGEWQALGLELEGEIKAVLIWSVENDDAGPVICINAMAGRVPGIDLTRAAVHLARTCGQHLGAVAIRFWTAREGLKRKAESMGFKSNYVLEGAI